MLMQLGRIKRSAADFSMAKLGEIKKGALPDKRIAN